VNRLSSPVVSDDFGNFLLWKFPANDFLLYQRDGCLLLLNGWDYTFYPVEAQEEKCYIDHIRLIAESRSCEDEIMSIHSKILVHWTGNNDIEKEPEDRKAQLYVERLKDYCQNGLFLKRNKEDVLRKLKIKDLFRLCFTEIRLSQAQEHAKNYGKLGVGFTKDFIKNNGGRPVIYIPFDVEHLLENSLREAFEKSKGSDEIHRPLKWVLAYVKRMSNGHVEEYYDEMEWRIVHDENPDNPFFAKDQEKDAYRFKFDAKDIKVIVLPNEEIKQMVSNDESLKIFFAQHMPILVTLEDCNNF
jgi:hypothetical protein